MQRFSPSDLLLFRTIKDLALSPDGDAVVYEVRIVDEEADDYRTSLWRAPVRKGDPFPFVQSKGEDTHPRWSPDGHWLAFVSTRSGKPQVHIVDRDGERGRRLTWLPKGVSSFEWSPRGDCLLVSAPMATGDEDAEEGKSKPPVVVDALRYSADGVGFTVGSKLQLFLVHIDGSDPEQLTSGEQDHTSATWSPTGAAIAYCKARREARSAHWIDLWVADRDGSNARRITEDLAVVRSPSWSPDGRYLVFEASREEGASIANLWYADLESEFVGPLGDDFLEPASDPLASAKQQPLWTPDSRAFHFLRARNGRAEVVRVAVPSGRAKTVFGGARQITALDIRGGRCAFLSTSFTEPADIWIGDLQTGEEARLTHANDWWWEARPRFHAQSRSFRRDGWNEQGWLLLPDRDARDVPLLVDVHGGPNSYAELGFPYHVYWYILLSRGWGILALNPIGSSGRGLDFAEELRSRWGELDLESHLHAVAQLQAEGVVGDAVAIAGKSYGGYLAAWAIGQTDVFRAAVVSAPVSNLESHFGTSDSGYYVIPYDVRGEPQDQRQKMRELSPVQHAHRASTPTLILQGQDDLRCPRGQAEELFTALARAGRAPVQMVIYPGGWHAMASTGTPSHRVDYHRRVADWVQQWCTEEPETSGGAKTSDPIHERASRRRSREPAPANRTRAR